MFVEGMTTKGNKNIRHDVDFPDRIFFSALYNLSSR